LPSIEKEDWPVLPNVSSPPLESTTTHRSDDGQAIATGELLVTEVEAVTCPVPGLKVSRCPRVSTAEHTLAVGQSTPINVLPGSIALNDGVTGDCGLNVASPPLPSTAVHWLVDGHATPNGTPLRSINVGVAPPGDCGLNVTCSPWTSTAVHCVADGQATAMSAEVPTAEDAAPRGDCGLNVTSCPWPSTAVHWTGDGHATASSPIPTACRSIATGADHDRLAEAAAGVTSSASHPKITGTADRARPHLIEFQSHADAPTSRAGPARL
jgi:hypothetical protein